MSKRYLIIFIIAIFILSITSVVLAADVHTTTSVINGVTVKWEYNIDKSNQIIDLKCTNPTELTGNVTIPSTLDGLNVVALGDDAFTGATNITKVVIPSSIKRIAKNSFWKCTGLTAVELGSVEEINAAAFADCTGLTSIKIPKTLKGGLTIIDTSIFKNCTNLTTITLEDGLETIPTRLLAGTNITEIKIPSSVKTIGSQAFYGCKSLKKVDLGSVEDINQAAFADCTGLTSIKIPKTLKSGPTIIDEYVFKNCTNLTTITLEDGLEVIPTRVLAGTNITEIKIPSSVKTIEHDAFLDCKKLTKIEIYDGVKDIYGLDSKEDKVFTNHNDNLTIYCYKDSMAAKYAINHNIKYVYLTKNEENKNNTVNNTTNNTANNTTTNNTTSKNNTIANTSNKTNTVNDTTIKGGVLPKTGIGFGLIISIISLVGAGLFTYFKYNNLKDIK